MKRGFTLIELLVVIAIIAILAAILFPVFAQARESARKTTCLSNVKQLALSHLMYAQDYDETFATSWSYGFAGEFSWFVQPYMKNINILLCPDRTTSTSLYALPNTPCGGNHNLAPGGVDNPFNVPTLWGYGFNTGLEWNDNRGATVTGTPNVFPDHTLSNMTVGGVTLAFELRGTPICGRPQAAFASASNCILLGDTGDTVVAGLGLGDLTIPAGVLGSCDALRLQNWPRHNGTNNVAFIDGHSKPYRFDRSPVLVGANTRMKVMPNDCQYLKDYDGSNNPYDCNLSLGTGITATP